MQSWVKANCKFAAGIPPAPVLTEGEDPILEEEKVEEIQRNDAKARQKNVAKERPLKLRMDQFEKEKLNTEENTAKNEMQALR